MSELEMSGSIVSSVKIESREGYAQAVRKALDAIGASEALGKFDVIVIKPNVVNAAKHPVTTDPACVAAVIDYLRCRVEAEIIVAEGSGEGTTMSNFEKLGYGDLGVPLLDLDSQPWVEREEPLAFVLNKAHIPRILTEAGIISVAPAKEHTITGVSLGLKNMVGCLPARIYGGFWTFKKSLIHQRDVHGAIADLYVHVPPHVTIVDAREGLKGGHLSGYVPEPPLERLIAGLDALEVDRIAASLLGHDPDSVKYLHLARKHPALESNSRRPKNVHGGKNDRTAEKT